MEFHLQIVTHSLFNLIFWGGLPYFIGIAGIELVRNEQKKLLDELGVYKSVYYYQDSGPIRFRRVFERSSIWIKLSLLLLVLLFGVISWAFKFVAVHFSPLLYEASVQIYLEAWSFLN